MEIIVVGDTVEAAIYEGLKKINKNRNDVKITILEKGDKDFLGLTGSKPAKIKIEYENYACSQPATQTSNSFESETTNKKSKKIKDTSSSSDNALSHAKKAIVNINENDINETKNILSEILTKLGLDCKELKTTIRETELYIEIVSDDSSLLIGKYGKTLHALQLLVNTLVNTKPDKKISVVLDTENYRDKRARALEKLTDKSVALLRKTNKHSILLPVLNNKDRKFVHNYLTRRYTNIISESIGEEPNRRIKLKFGQK